MKVYVAEIHFFVLGQRQQDTVGVYSSLEKAIEALSSSKFAFYGHNADANLVDDKRIVWLGKPISNEKVDTAKIIEITGNASILSPWYEIFKERGELGFK